MRASQQLILLERKGTAKALKLVLLGIPMAGGGYDTGMLVGHRDDLTEVTSVGSPVPGAVDVLPRLVLQLTDSTLLDLDTVDITTLEGVAGVTALTVGLASRIPIVSRDKSDVFVQITVSHESLVHAPNGLLACTVVHIADSSVLTNS